MYSDHVGRTGSHIVKWYLHCSVFLSNYASASLDLADYSDGESDMEVDMLIGSDFYWDLVTGGLSRGEGPRVPLPSTLD